MINKGIRPRKILTLEGEVEYRRTVFVPKDKDSAALLKEKYDLSAVVPLDMALGINKLPFKISPQMVLDIARRAINAHSYAELQQMYKDDWGIDISDDLIRNVTNYIGKMVYDEDCARREEDLEHLRKQGTSPRQSAGTSKNTHVLYIEMDGAMLNTRKRENDFTWKENKLGLVFSSKDLISYKNQRQEDIKRIGKREYISYVGSSETFLDFLYSIALRNGLEDHGKIVIISDGARWIKKFKETYCQGLDVTHILDYSHLKENVYKFAQVFIRGKCQKSIWPEELCTLVKEGKIDEALAMSEPYKDCHKPGIPNVYKYLLNNIDSIDYPKYMEAGFFIGSGAFESSNKSTMQERFKLPGMRWDITSAQYVLSAKMKYDSGKWYSDVVPLLFKTLDLQKP